TCSGAIRLRAISPRPPRGMERNLGCLAKKGELLLRLDNRRGGGGEHLTPLLHPVEVGLDGLEVLLQRPHQEAVIQCGRRMVDGDVAHAVLDDQFSMQSRDGLISGKQTPQRVPPQYEHNFRLDQTTLLSTIW